MPLGGAIHRLAAGTVEALLLIMAAQAVLLIDPHAIRWADFVKTTHLRALVPLLALCWGVYVVVLRRGRADGGLTESTRAGSRRFPFIPSPWLALGAVVASTMLSTLLSVAPGVSLWGDRRLTTGLLSLLTWAVVFGAAATVLRTWAQVERLLRVLLLTTLSAAVLGLLEGVGQSPLAGLLAIGQRAGSTMGNPIFFGSLLVIVLPIALAWLWIVARPQSGAPPDTSQAQTAPRNDRKRWARGHGKAEMTGVGVGACIGALAGQQALFVAWLFLVSTRPDAPWAGPAILVAFVWLGMVASGDPASPCRHGGRMLDSAGDRRLAVGGLAMLSVVLLVVLLLTRARGPWLAAGVAVAVLVVWLGRPRWRRWAVVVLPALGALLAVLSIYSGTEMARLTATITGRSASEGDRAVQSRVLTWQTAAALVAAPPELAGSDVGPRPVRLLVGYGPDTLRLLTEQTYPAALRAIENEAQITSGHNDLLDRVATVGLLGTAAWLALLASVVWAARVAYRRADERQRILLGGLLAGLAGYAVEQMVGPAYPPVRTLAWLLAGALVGLAQGETRGHTDAQMRRKEDAETRGRGEAARLTFAAGYAALTFAAALALPPASLDHLGRTATGWWAWSLVGILGMAVALVPPAQRRISRGVVLAGVIFMVGGALWGSQALRPLVAERLHSASAGALRAGDLGAAAGLASDARAVWPIDERYDFDFGMALIQVAGAQRGRLPQRLPQPAPPPEPFEPLHLTRATPEQLLDWGVWLVERAAQRQPLDFEYPLGRARTYRALAELLGSEEARAEARRSLAVAQRLSPTHPAVVELARQMGVP